MSSKYQEQTATGSTWVRCKGVMIQNHLTSPPVCYFDESRVTEVNGIASEQAIGSITRQFNPSEEVVLLNPETNEPTGEVITQAYLYQVLYSLYMAAATERDAAVAEAAASREAALAAMAAPPVVEPVVLTTIDTPAPEASELPVTTPAEEPATTPAE